MATIRVPAGFARGESNAAIPGRYSRGNLVRWQNGDLKPIGGWNRNTAQPLASTPRYAFTWLDGKFNRYSGFICDGNVYVALSGTYTDITPPDWVNFEEAYVGYGAGRYGTLNYGDDTVPRDTSAESGVDPDNYRIKTQQPIAYSAEKWGVNGEFLFGTSIDGKVHVWTPPTDTEPAKLGICANAPQRVQSFIVTDEQHLMCFGGDGVPNRVAWSDQTNREGWNFANQYGQAGYFDLQDAGAIYTAKLIPGGILIFTQTSVWLGKYIGYPNYYGFTKLASSVAPLSPQAVVVASNMAFWWGQGQFFAYQSGTVQPVPCDLGLDPFESADQYYTPRRLCAGFNGVYNEIWWFYPSKGQNAQRAENDRYVIFNFQDKWWADGYLPRSFYTSSPIDNFPVAGTPEGHIFTHEQGYMDNMTPIGEKRFVEIETLSFEDGDRLYSVTQMQTDSGGDPQNVRFEFDCRMARGGANLPTESYIPRDDGYVDTRFTARDFTMRIYGTVDAPWAVGGLNFDMKPRGKR